MANQPNLRKLGCALLATAACGSSSGPSPSAPADASTAPAAIRTFVGDVTGTDARVAVLATATHARIYFCGGDASFATRTHWIPSAAVAGTQLAPPSPDSTGWSVEGQVDDAGASGSVVMGDAGTFAFHANPLAAGTIAGLYEAQGPCGHLGVIVSQASPADSPAAQGACLPAVGSGMASVEQVNPIQPLSRASDGSIGVLVNGAQVSVRAAAPPAD
jgi:hypothetical protein